MHDDAQFVAFEVDAIIAEAKAVEAPAFPLQFPKSIQLRRQDLVRQAAEFAQNEQLEIPRHLREFRRADWIENNLERSHRENW
jgi:hypothetical protein